MMKRRDLLLIPAAALGVMIANVAISVGVVWVYSTFIEPGRPVADYEAFAMTAAPVSSIVAGVPLMVLAGFFLARGRSDRAALSAAGAVALLYIAVDAALMKAAGAGSEMWALEAASYSTKLLSALAGAKLRASRSGREARAVH
jgi:hypothetical protein